ncbi:MAG TPA: ribosome maturation factor RimP [Trueperaceae bacterium]
MDLAQAASGVLHPLGYEVLELQVGGKGKKKRVLLRIDRLDEGVVTLEDVTLATQVFGLELDRLDPFEGAYQLEVESPGPERPLVTARHFERFHDLAIKVRADGESFKGIIREVAPDAVVLEVGDERRSVPLDRIESARLAEWPESPR